MNSVEIEIEEEKCPWCGGVLVKRNGPYGKFYGCSNYPSCRYTRSLGIRNKIDYINDFVKTLLNISVEDFIYSLPWYESSDLCIRILYNKTTLEDEQYLSTQLIDKHRMDSRNPVSFAQSLVTSWIIEDCLVQYFQSLGHDTILNSADYERKFLITPTSNADFKIVTDKHSIPVELVTDYYGNWQKQNCIPLRDYKYPNLVKEKSYLLGIDFVNNAFTFLYIHKKTAQYVDYYDPFQKPAYLLDVEKKDFCSLNELQTIFNGK